MLKGVIMGYQEELREQAQKRKRRDFRFKMILLVIFLIIVLVAMHWIGNYSVQPNNTKAINANNVERVPNQSEAN